MFPASVQTKNARPLASHCVGKVKFVLSRLSTANGNRIPEAPIIRRKIKAGKGEQLHHQFSVISPNWLESNPPNRISQGDFGIGVILASGLGIPGWKDGRVEVWKERIRETMVVSVQANDQPAKRLRVKQHQAQITSINAP
jgi:hypothetical protein